MLGTAALMVKMGVRIHAGQGTHTCVYLVVDNALAGVLTMRYQPTKHTYQAMRLMRRMHNERRAGGAGFQYFACDGRGGI